MNAVPINLMSLSIVPLICTIATKVANQATINSLIIDGVGLNDSLGHERQRLHR
jgi:hypothetical protein